MTGPLSYSVAGAAAATGLSASQIKRLIATGDLKAKGSEIRSDGRVSKYVILAPDLKAYLDQLEDV